MSGLKISSTWPLNNGHHIPVFGLGTFMLKGDHAREAVKSAIQAGYRFIDAAYIYGNEQEIGRGIKESIDSGLVQREDLFVESKVWNNFHSTAKVKEACERSLKELSLDHLDMYLMHWPQGYAEGGVDYPKNQEGKIMFSGVDYLETWSAMEELVKQGKTRGIGLSNFNIEQINRILEHATIKPAVLQVECHPYLTQEPLRDLCVQHGIVMIGYSPLGSRGSQDAPKDAPRMLEDILLAKIGRKYGKTSGQAALRFQIQRGVIPIPKSGNSKHICSNADIFDFELSHQEMKDILGLNRSYRYIAFAQDSSHPFYPF